MILKEQLERESKQIDATRKNKMFCEYQKTLFEEAINNIIF
jgi:hypothetical protein